MRRWWLLPALMALGCGDDAASPDAPPAPDAGATGDATSGGDGGGGIPSDWSRDVLSTDLELDLGTLHGVATIRVAASAAQSGVVTLAVPGLTIQSVKNPALGTGIDLPYEIEDGNIDISTAPVGEATIRIEYDFPERPATAFDGWMSNGLSFLWPDFCGNLYPCKPDPDDGSTYTITVTGVPAGMQLVFPEAIPSPAPSYMPALALGDYTEEVLGTTTAGTRVAVWYLPGGQGAALAGAASLAGYFEFFETTYGAYSFGDSVASVSAPWGPGAYGGMEHHPFWHVATGAMSDPNVHAHEAAHGWFGNGVRIACWEDFVLSEGTVTYLAARAIEAVDGAAAGDAQWAAYQSELDAAVASGDTIAWPSGCNEIDIINDPLWSSIPYMKGAFFFRNLELMTGRAELDAALRSFYEDHVGQAAGMQDLLDHILAETGIDPGPLAEDWLRSLGTP